MNSSPMTTKLSQCHPYTVALSCTSGFQILRDNVRLPGYDELTMTDALRALHLFASGDIDRAEVSA